MTKKVILVHGWGGNPGNNWFPWLKKNLEEKDFEVIVPKMPNAEEPEINSWVEKLREVSGDVNENVYFIGHSIGCQTIMRYLEQLPAGSKVGGVIFVAGFFNLPNLETNEEKEIAKPWLETPIDTDKIKRITNDIVAVFSDDDPDVPLDDSKLFQERLGAKIVIEHEKEHFSDDAGIKELPIVLNEFFVMAGMDGN